MVCDQGEMAPKQVWVELLNSKHKGQSFLLELQVVSLTGSQCIGSKGNWSFRPISKNTWNHRSDTIWGRICSQHHGTCCIIVHQHLRSGESLLSLLKCTVTSFIHLHLWSCCSNVCKGWKSWLGIWLDLETGLEGWVHPQLLLEQLWMLV